MPSFIHLETLAKRKRPIAVADLLFLGFRKCRGQIAHTLKKPLSYSWFKVQEFVLLRCVFMSSWPFAKSCDVHFLAPFLCFTVWTRP